LLAEKTLAGELTQGLAHAAFASLAAIVDGRVDDVHAELDGPYYRLRVQQVGFLVVLPEVGSEADRGQREIRRLPEVPGGDPVPDSCFGIGPSAIGSCRSR
jgi:hypothetical protein